MKKLLFIAVALIGFSVSAQERIDTKEAMKIAEKESIELAKKTAGLLQIEDNETFEKFSEAIKSKLVMTAQNPDLSDARKEALSNYILATFEEILTKDQLKKLKSEPELYNRLIK